MNPLFKDIKIIAWDVDTTLYKNIPELSLAFKKGCIEEFARIKKLSLKEAEKIFETQRNKYGSTSLALKLVGIDTKKMIPLIQKRINKPSYIKPDPKLLEMFKKLSNFRHFIITNAMPESNQLTLKKLGVPENLFERIITAADTQEPKPDLEPFRLLLKTTGLPPEQHVYIGDREKVDIIPAKKLGLKTILVWGISEVADLSLPTVYDVTTALT